MRVLTCAAVLSCGVIAACQTGSPREIANRPADRLQVASDSEVVTAYSYERHGSVFEANLAKLKGEIDRRGLFSSEQWAMIDAKKIAVGEPEFLVWASWGPPDRVRSFTDAKGSTRALMYGQTNSTVYTDGQRVTGILR